MLRNLPESWLDSASERTYQPVFCQMLSAQGHTILHSTRHSPLEFGKDVLTIDPNGRPCAYQLKGNPGSRLTLEQFRNIQTQLVQLVTQPIIFPGLKIQTHKTYLVTNGIVEEEVQRAIDDLNRGFCEAKTIGGPIELISRGQLLKWAINLGVDLWPAELLDVNRLLQLLVAQGDEILPDHLLHDLLISLLCLDENIKTTPSASELKRRITSAALLTAVSLQKFYIKKNHWAIICGWVIFSSYTIGACERHNKSYKKNGKHSIDIALYSIFLSLSNLCSELQTRNHYIEGNALVDSFIYKGRYTLLVALMVTYWFWGMEEGWMDENHQSFLDEFIPKNPKGLYLWGEGAIPQLLIHLWYLRHTDPTLKPDFFLASLLQQIIKICIDDKLNGLPSPYYSFESITRHIFRNLLSLKEDPLGGDSFRYNSFFALPLMHLLVRANMKQTCKSIWPDFSKLSFKYFDPLKPWMYCLKEVPHGDNITIQPKLTKEWDELKVEARENLCVGVPISLKINKYLFILFIILFPYRATPSAIRYLATQFHDSWFIEAPIDN